MATTEERIMKLVDEHLDIEGRSMGRPLDLDSSLRESGVSSLDFLAFAKLLDAEFNVEFGADTWATINTTRELIARLDADAA